MKLNRIVPIIFSLGLIVCAGTLVVISEPEPTPSVIQEEIKQPVSITVVEPRSYQPVIKLLGTSYTRWSVDIKSPSGARLKWLNKNATPGSLVLQGEILAQIDTTHLKSQLAQAHSELMQAELSLQREQHEQTVALRMLSGKKSSAFARREPQLASAKAEVQYAREIFISAKQRLQDATIVAPFNAVILDRTVSPGQQVEAGEQMFKIASSESLDIRVPVPDQQWDTLSATLDKPQIQIIDKQGNKRLAQVRYIEPEADNVTRQRQVILTVDEPYKSTPKLFPNQQLKIEVTLTRQEYVMSVPLSALTRDGQIWTVDDDNKLRLEDIQLLQETRHSANIVFTHSSPHPRRIVIYPLLSMLSGAEVSPDLVEIEDSEMRKLK